MAKQLSLPILAAIAVTGCFDGNSLTEGNAKDAVQKNLAGSMYCYAWPSKSPETAILFDKETQFLGKIAKAGWVNVTPETVKNVVNISWFTSTPKEGYALASHINTLQMKPNANLYVVRLTEKGRALHKPASRSPETGSGTPGLCSGQRRVTSIKRFSAPAPDASGKIVSEVAFRYDFTDLDAEMKATWEEQKGKVAAGQEGIGIVQVMKTNNGWITNGNVRYAMEAI